MEEEYANQEQLKELIRKGVIASAHDVSEGGLFIALLESAMQSGLGFDITTDVEIRPDAYLFWGARAELPRAPSAFLLPPRTKSLSSTSLMLNGVPCRV